MKRIPKKSLGRMLAVLAQAERFVLCILARPDFWWPQLQAYYAEGRRLELDWLCWCLGELDASDDLSVIGVMSSYVQGDGILANGKLAYITMITSLFVEVLDSSTLVENTNMTLLRYQLAICQWLLGRSGFRTRRLKELRGKVEHFLYTPVYKCESIAELLGPLPAFPQVEG